MHSTNKKKVQIKDHKNINAQDKEPNKKQLHNQENLY